MRPQGPEIPFMTPNRNTSPSMHYRSAATRKTATCAVIIFALLATSCRTMKEPKEERPRLQVKVKELINHLNEDCDLLHFEYTPAVHQLIRLGLPALRKGVL